MANEVGFPTEGLSTLGTAVGLLSCVYSVVHSEDRLLAEGLPTVIADVGLLPGVDSLVEGESRLLAEGLAAVGTDVWFLSGVRPLVDGEGCLLDEGLPTLCALVGLLSCVSSLVVDEVGLLSKGTATLSAFVGFLARVCFVVSGEGCLLAEGLPTVQTKIGFPLYMCFFMKRQGCLLAEGFPTLAANIGLLSRVDALVLDEVGLPPKAVPTVRTLEGLLHLRSGVHKKNGLSAEEFPVFVVCRGLLFQKIMWMNTKVWLFYESHFVSTVVEASISSVSSVIWKQHSSRKEGIVIVITSKRLLWKLGVLLLSRLFGTQGPFRWFVQSGCRVSFLTPAIRD